MSHDSDLSKIQRQASAARRAMAGDTRPSGNDNGGASQPVEVDTFLDHYFKRIDPEVAASFSKAQCEAMKVMFGARVLRRHSLDFRPTLSLGRDRFYMVLLAGRDRRAVARETSNGGGIFLAVLALVVLILLPVLAVA